MAFPVLRYAITDSLVYGESEALREAGLIKQARRLADLGIEFLQLRERDLAAGRLAALTQRLLRELRLANPAVRLLVHGRPDVAAATGAHGVHLPSGPDQLLPEQARRVLVQKMSVSRNNLEPARLESARPESAHPEFAIPRPTVSVSCHTLAEVQRACDGGADLVLFGPVFGKHLHGSLVSAPLGLKSLAAACAAAGETPVLALGGVTAENTSSCIDAGARGIAAIRLFQ